MRPLSEQFVAPRPVAWFFFILGFGLTLTLGTWQLERLRWKEQLISSIAEAGAKTPRVGLPADVEELTDMQFARVKLHGTWIKNIEFHLAPRYFHNKLGFSIITPFKLSDGRTVLINRGWVPSAKKMPETRPETKVSGRAVLTGMVRVGRERNAFTPTDQPERNVWFGRDSIEMAEFAHLENVAPVMVDLIGTQDESRLPVPSDGTIKLKNDHLGYLITWYGIALGILVIFIVYHHKKA